MERVVLRRLPKSVIGSLLLALSTLLARLVDALAPAVWSAGSLMSTDIYVVSLIILHWTVVLTVAIAAFIILVMKGPAFVADAYPLDEMERWNPRRLAGHDKQSRKRRRTGQPLGQIGAPGQPGLGWPTACWLKACASGRAATGPASAICLLTPGNALAVADQLSRLRGAAMKVGQLLSMDAGDLMPPNWQPSWPDCGPMRNRCR